MLAGERWLMGSARWRLIGIAALALLTILAFHWGAELTFADEPPRLVVKYQGTELTDGTVARVTETGSDSSVILTLELSERPTPATGKLARFGDDPAITVYPFPAGVLLANLDFVHPPDIDITPFHTPARLTTFQFNTTNWSATQRLKLTSGTTSPGTYELHGELLASDNFHGVKFPEIEIEVVAGNSLGSLSPVTLPSTPAPTPTATTTRRIWIHSDHRINEGDSASFQISVSQPSTSDITVSVSTKDGTAKAGEDYVAAKNKQVTIPAGKSSASVQIRSIFDNAHPEDDERFTVEIAPVSVGDYAITDAAVTATIVSLIPPKCVDSVSKEDLKVSLPEEHVYSRKTWQELRLFENKSRQFDVTLTNKPCDEASLKIWATQEQYDTDNQRYETINSPEITFSSDGATFGDSLTLSFDGSNWSAPQTVTLRHHKGSMVNVDSEFTTYVRLTAKDKSATEHSFYGNIVRWNKLRAYYSRDKVNWGDVAGIRTLDGKEQTFTYWMFLGEDPLLPVTLDIVGDVQFPMFPLQLDYRVQPNQEYRGQPPRFKVEPASLTFTPENYREPQKVTLTTIPDKDGEGYWVFIEHQPRELPNSEIYGYVNLAIWDHGKYTFFTIPYPHYNSINVTEGFSAKVKIRMRYDPGEVTKVTVTNPEPKKVTLSATTLTFTPGDDGTWYENQWLTVSSPWNSVWADETFMLSFTITKGDGTDLGLAPFKRKVKVTNINWWDLYP